MASGDDWDLPPSRLANRGIPMIAFGTAVPPARLFPFRICILCGSDPASRLMCLRRRGIVLISFTGLCTAQLRYLLSCVEFGPAAARSLHSTGVLAAVPAFFSAGTSILSDELCGGWQTAERTGSQSQDARTAPSASWTASIGASYDGNIPISFLDLYTAFGALSLCAGFEHYSTSTVYHKINNVSVKSNTENY